ncbi:MAG: DNA recombination protein RmuC [Cyclobacteriaceae bacterium]|nr:DNA recombination protein RmuC [Cyclobacteriaceae bacterium]
MEYLYLITGIIIGGVASYFYFKSNGGFGNDNEGIKEQVLKDAIIEWKDKVIKVETDLEKERRTNIDLNRQVAGREMEVKNLQEKLFEQKKEIQVIQEKFSLEFKNLANQIFEEKSKKFTDQNKQNILDILNPLGERISSFEKKVEETSKESIARNSALREQISGLKELNIKITKEAENLTKALKGDSKAQGNWGEVILERILESSGLEKGREYSVQDSFNTQEGKRLQPDVIINLPDNKNIVVDSKVSLIAYEQFVNGEDNTGKQIQHKAHLNSVRTHMKNLSEKNYQSLYGIKGLDFVLMFIPIEPAFSMAVSTDESLYLDAYTKNIILVSPTTLLATLRTIANIWKNEYQNRNALEIARQSSDLYDKFVGFTDDLLLIGKQINGSQKAYDDAIKKLSEGKGNLISRTERLRKLGISPSKQIDPKFLDKPED